MTTQTKRRPFRPLQRGCFVLETKQATETPDQQKATERAELGLTPEKRRR